MAMDSDKRKGIIEVGDLYAEVEGDVLVATDIPTIDSSNEFRLCTALDAEPREMQERMANRQVYESSGRACVLSGLNSHSWQRAIVMGESTDSWSSATTYQLELCAFD